MIEVLKAEIEKQLNQKYEEWKEEKLKDLDIELELKRNKIISELLNSITIIQETEMYSNNPVINIRIDRKVVEVIK